jgi:hypothetical protein
MVWGFQDNIVVFPENLYSQKSYEYMDTGNPYIFFQWEWKKQEQEVWV